MKQTLDDHVFCRRARDDQGIAVVPNVAVVVAMVIVAIVGGGRNYCIVDVVVLAARVVLSW